MRIGLNSPQAFLSLVIRRRWWIILPFVALSCMVGVLAKSLPKVYVSKTLILVKPREVPTSFVVDLIAGSVEERLKSIEQTVMSRTHLAEVIREFGDQLPELRGMRQDAKIEKLRKQITIAFTTGSAVNGVKPISYFTISYENQTPALAQKITSKITTLFIQKDGENRGTQVAGTMDFFARALSKVEADLRESDARLKGMKATRQFELPERLDTNLKTLERLALDARSVEESIGRNVTARLNTEDMLAGTSPTIAKPGPPLQPSQRVGTPAAPTAEDAKITDFRKQQVSYDQLTSVYGSNYPEVRSAKVILENMRAKLSPEELEKAENPPATPASSVDAIAATIPTVPGAAPGTEPNPRYQSLSATLADLNTEYKILQNRKTEIARDIATYNRRVENTPQIEQELADVERENADLQKDYKDLKAKLSQAELSASLESEEKGGQFQIIDPANLPSSSAKPNKPMVALGGTIVSLLLSLAFAVGVDVARQRIWTQSEIEAFWGTRVLVSIPEILTDGDVAAAKRKKWIFVTSAVGAALVFSVCLYGMHLKHDFILRQLDPVLQKVVYK